MITATLESKRIFWALARSSLLPQGKVLRLDWAEHGDESNGHLVDIMLGEPERDDLVVAHEGEPVAYVSSEVGEIFQGHLFQLKLGPLGLSVAIEPPSANQEEQPSMKEQGVGENGAA